MDNSNTIQLRYGVEDLVSRIPGLFPWFEYGEDGVTRLRSAKDAPNGCYGKVACGLRLPSNVSLTHGGETILLGGEAYSYRTLMNEYYRYRNLLPEDDPFLFFMDTCVGLYQIWADPNLPDGIDLSECDLIPEYGYYGEASRIYSEYCSISNMCAAYERMKRDSGEINCELECLLDRYARMGGDAMRDYYHTKASECADIADMVMEAYAEPIASTVDVGLSFVSTSEDLGVLTTYLNQWEPGARYVGGDIVVHDGRTWVCTCGEGEYTEGAWDPDLCEIVFDTQNFTMLSSPYNQQTPGTEWIMTGYSESQLQVFKDGMTYTDEGGTTRLPQNGEDWLWYYKIGAIANCESDTDRLGNITIQDGETRNTVIGQYDTHLNAYGDVLVSITPDQSVMTVTFSYVIGANLKAILTDSVTDSVGDTRYYYSGYAYNADDSHGVRYEETYSFCGDLSEINEILSNGDFTAYVTGSPIDYACYTCPFSTSDASVSITQMVNGVPVTSNSVIGMYNVSVGVNADILVSPVFKDDSLVGFPFMPHVESDVFVNRGNCAAWERHMKLGECRSFDDLENYSNGGFFNLMTQ